MLGYEQFLPPTGLHLQEVFLCHKKALHEFQLQIQSLAPSTIASTGHAS